ncbi:HTH-type transcriptional regulator/antitoxin HigA [Azospirillum fermentarium]|uniref:helix-turn-helix domain-containing protein n=1 Tax=Azospirillum fermentarium TaxID=1233114 RepID=UPI002226FCAF|nr:helix-turn-helix domain-containing protein [Azospirillum fermentarium]MCW2245660.1 HTH-type transcriptional regulator/antitoxin HigA [Azospirillum fermentarium]
MPELKPIRTDADHDAAVREIERLWDAEPGTPEHDRLEILGTLADAYEATRWPIDAPDPVEAIKARMDAAGYTQADLSRLLGSRPRASEVLNRQRRLTVEMAWKLHEAWAIPAESLIRPYKLRAPETP